MPAEPGFTGERVPYAHPRSNVAVPRLAPFVTGSSCLAVVADVGLEDAEQ